MHASKSASSPPLTAACIGTAEAVLSARFLRSLRFAPAESLAVVAYSHASGLAADNNLPVADSQLPKSLATNSCVPAAGASALHSTAMPHTADHETWGARQQAKQQRICCIAADIVETAHVGSLPVAAAEEVALVESAVSETVAFGAVVAVAVAVVVAAFVAAFAFVVPAVAFGVAAAASEADIAAVEMAAGSVSKAEILLIAAAATESAEKSVVAGTFVPYLASTPAASLASVS